MSASHRVLLSDVPSSLPLAELERQLSGLGLDSSSFTAREGSGAGEVTLCYSSKEQAEAAAARLAPGEGQETAEIPDGAGGTVKLRAKLVLGDSANTTTSAQQGQQQHPRSSNHNSSRSPRKTLPGGGGGGGGHGFNHHQHGGHGGAFQQGAGGGGRGGGGGGIDFPLRILVQSDMVGAIIGRGGQTIRQITQQTRARVDVHRRESAGQAEKAITIYGMPENCTNACARILGVVEEEATNMGKPPQEVSLKVLAHNNLIGRIIGKQARKQMFAAHRLVPNFHFPFFQGSTIKRVMEETGTRIAVSSINEITSYNPERTITITGDVGAIEAVSRAEAEISAKLRAAYESDINSMPVSGTFRKIRIRFVRDVLRIISA